MCEYNKDCDCHLFDPKTDKDSKSTSLAINCRPGEKAKWFKKGFHAALRKKNSSGCCCVFDDDGETLLVVCSSHRKWKKGT